MSDERHLKSHLRELTSAVADFLSQLDTAMKGPATPERGREIARLSNALEMANDRARYFGLGVDYRTDKRAPK